MQQQQRQSNGPVQIRIEDLKKTQLLGRGSFSDVYLVGTTKLKSQELALKQLNSRSVRSQEACNRAALDLLEEGMILSKIDHPNIIALRGVSHSTAVTDPQSYFSEGGDDGMHGTDYFLLLDVLSETLEDRLHRWSQDESSRIKRRKFGGRFFQRKRHKASTNKQLGTTKMLERITSVALDVASAMEYLHDAHIIFQDLKPENIGFDLESDELKLFDFGMATVVDSNTGIILGSSSNGDISWAGTPRYMAPEVFQGRGGSKKADVYSFGILLYVICTLDSSFGPRRLSVLQNYVCSGGRPTLNDMVSDKATRRLIRDCLATLPEQRPSFAEIRSTRLPEILGQAEVVWSDHQSSCGNSLCDVDLSTRSVTSFANSAFSTQ